MDQRHFGPEHDDFRARVRAFIQAEVLPNVDAWRAAMVIDRDHLRGAAERGFLGLSVDTALGGHGLDDYRYHQVVLQEYEYAGVGPCATGIMLQNDIVAPYLAAVATPEQKERWLRPLSAAGSWGALAITEPQAGSDVAGVTTTATRDGAGWRINGRKKYIGCGINADFVMTVARTGAPDSRHRGLSLIVVEHDRPGFRRVQNIPRVGREPQDVAELAFEDVWVPQENLLGEENRGFYYLMENLPKERLQVAVTAVAACRHIFDLTLDHARHRQAFGRPIGANQAIKFAIAEMSTELDIAEQYVDRCVRALNAGELSAVDAAKAKWWCSELQVRFADRCFEIHGAAGYMDNTPMSRAWRESRVTTIYAGTNEIMKEIIGRSHGL